MLQLLKTSLGRLRTIAFIEGMSYLILLGIAVPLKYVWGQPAAVKSLGSIHGFLFVLYILCVILCHIEYRWTLKKTFILLAVSVIPFGNFYADKHYLGNENN